MTGKEYVEQINLKYQTGNHDAAEHSYREILERFLQSFGVQTINDGRRQECGAPDIRVYRNNNVIGYIETKDIDVSDLEGKKQNKEQFTRYKKALGNLIFTDYLDFHFYNGEEYIDDFCIGKLRDGKIVYVAENEEKFQSFFKNFTNANPQKITSYKKLAAIMAQKAKLIKLSILKTLEQDNDECKKFRNQIEIFKQILIHDLDEKKFADIYAQTITYGLFVARIHDKTPETFSRIEAINLLPSTNPFLQDMFDLMVGRKMNENLKWIVDDLVTVFGATNLEKLMSSYGMNHDVVLHFYEDFLSEYDSKLREKMGVFYTPEPVVKFIVSSVDTILKKDFNIIKGIASDEKVLVKQRYIVSGKEKSYQENIFRVQILDPAIGTGTFLAEVIKQIYATFQNKKAVWNDYVDTCLLERLNGFEYMMSPHTMAHIKLGTILEETGWKNNEGKKRLKVYLTNSLEKDDLSDRQLDLFAEAISNESREAREIKNNCPVMCVIGNPPYNNKSSNKGEWILGLIKEYKAGLGEKKVNLDDDYIKFIRLAQEYINENGSGIVAYITNNSFVEGVTHRKMRKSLLQTFDKIYILNLHGNSLVGEEVPDNGVDENVFNIQQGVSINIFVKTSNSKKNAVVYYSDLFGKQNDKYEFLLSHALENVQWKEIELREPYYFFAPKDFSQIETYEKGFSITDLMRISNSGIKTDRDKLFFDANEDELKKRIEKLLKGDYDETFANTYDVKNSSSYNLLKKIKNHSFEEQYISKCQYRPFVYKYLYYDKTIISRPADKVMKHMRNLNNIGLICSRQFGGYKHFICFITNKLIEISSQPYAPYTLFPLYLYPTDNCFEEERVPNLNLEIWGKINKAIKEETTPEQVLDYIYGVLHSLKYRITYKEFLKIEFPRIPYPKNKEAFYHYAKFGNQLRQLHLMENVKTNEDWAILSIGSNIVEKQEYKNGRVYINKEQYFDNVPESAWNIYIAGYQPAQQWLTERKKDNYKLGYKDVEEYQKIITILMETKRVRDEIDQKNYFD